MRKACEPPVQLPLSFDAVRPEESCLAQPSLPLVLKTNVVSVEFRRPSPLVVPIQACEVHESKILESLLARAKAMDW